MRNISSWAIKNPVFPLVLFIMLTFAGLISFIRLPVTNNPDISFPVVQVTVSQPGASPTEMETQVTQKIEGAVAGIGNVEDITSWTPEGTANVVIKFHIGTNIDRATSDVRDAVAKIRSDLPEGIEEPVVQRQDADGGNFVAYAVSTSDMTEQQLSWFVDNNIAKRLLVLNGVSQVSRGGGVNREIRILLDPQRLQAYGLTAAGVNQQLRTVNLDAAGGRGDIAGSEQSIRVLGGAKTAQQLADTRISVPGRQPVRLSDIAEVKDSFAEVRNLSRVNGRNATTFGITKAKGYSEVTVSKLVEKELTKILKENPNIKISQVYTQVDDTKLQYESALRAMIEGAVLAVLVVYLFLRDGRATFISALAIPLSAIPTFWIMSLLGFTLNSISLLALSLVAGILVDDAIVEIENIVRHMRMGKSAYRAALEAADEIGLAVVATSMSIVAVFLPVSFMGGIVGQYFKQFGLTVAVAVLMSLLVARTLTPIIAAYFLKPHGEQAHANGPIMQFYLRSLNWAIGNRWKTVLIGVAFLAATLVMFAVIPKGLFPQQDNGYGQVNIEVPPGTRFAELARLSERVTTILRSHKEVASVNEDIGGDEGRTAFLFINYVDKKDRNKTSKQIEEMITKELRDIPDAHINFADFSGGGGGRPVTLFLTGDDPELLERTARTLEKQMQALPELQDARVDGDMKRPEIVIKPRFDLAAQLGVSVQALGQTIRVATIGDIPQNLAKFSLADRQVPIRVSLQENSRANLDTLLNLPVPTADGGAVPLRAVADVSFGSGPSRVRHYNQSRRIMLVADLNHVPLEKALNAVNNLPTLKNLPSGVRKVDQGDAQLFQELISNFMIAFAAGIFLVFAVLVLLYQRAFQPFTNMASLLLAPGGGLALLMLTGYEMTMPVFIGILMLFGIVAKNSILLIDFAIEEMNKGTERAAAIWEAGHKRAQPIVMTTVAMIAGMLPVAFSVGGDGFRAPMGVVVIGGLALSTILTLIIIPAGFTIVDDIEKWLAPRIGKLLTTRRKDDHLILPHAAE